MHTNNWREKIGLLAVLVVLTVYYLSQQRSPLDEVEPVVDLDLINDRIQLLGKFKEDEVLSIREELPHLFTGRCTAAFIHAGVRSPLQVVLETGVVLRPSSDLYTESARSLGLTYDATRQIYKWEFSSGRAQAGTVSPTRNGVRLTGDGRPRVFLHETAFVGSSYLFNWLSLREVLIHEFIHVGGQPPTPGLLGPLQHDLAGFAPYDDIMAACR